MHNIQLGNHTIGANYPPFIIAEMSGNHNHSLDRALEIVDSVATTGCQAIKIQTYTADTMTIDSKRPEFFIEDPNSLWKDSYLYQLYEQAFTPWEWHEPIFERCKKHNITCFSTPFDETAVDFLEQFDMPFYKIASFENTDLPLIQKVAKTGKPIIISTGMATVSELSETVEAAKQAGCTDLVLLKCTSSYPSIPKEANILTIPHLKELFDVQVGLSDHTMGIGVGVASVALGATVIEKHYTLRRADGGVDSAFSMEPEEMKMLVEESTKAFYSLGKVHYGRTEKEERSLRFRRSIFAVENIKKGEKFTGKNIRRIRPGYGLAPKYFDILVGKTATKDIERGTPMSWDLLE